MKKIVKSALTLIFALTTVLTLVACNGGSDEQTLVVGSPEISGNFMSGFGNSAYDVWVRDLIFGYGTYSTTELGEIVLNETVVDTVTTDEASNGDKTYTFVIHDDLLWSDDEPIMADDFVFNLLMSASQNWVAAGASSTAGDSLIGYSEYRNMDNPNYDPDYDPTLDTAWAPLTEAQFLVSDEYLDDQELDPEDRVYYADYAAYLAGYRASYLRALPASHKKNAVIPRTNSAEVKFAGVQLLGDYSFSVTISADELPYFYETSYASVGPAPMHILAPEDAVISSDSNGASISANGFTLLSDVAKVGGYRYFPTVSAGPYKFVSFVNQVVTLEMDENFKGNVYGDTPTIQNIVIRRVNQTLDVDLVISGEIDLVTGVIEGSKIQAAETSATTSTNYYSRNGYGLLAMQAHFGPTMDYQVRQAISYLTDRQYVTDVVLDGYGSIVFSEYGLAQWMYVQSEDWVDANLNKYSFSVTSANDVLDETEWKFEDDGVTPFDVTKAVAGSEYYRHNAAGDTLFINHLGTENNEVTTSLAAKFEINMQLAGIEYNNDESDFAFLLDHYYYAYDLEEEEKMYHIFNLATNFSVAYDPYYSWHTDFLGTWMNGHQLEDSPETPAAPLNATNGTKTLDELTVSLRTVEPGDTAEYLELWREYQVRWNALIPNVPLYSNQYYDVFNSDLKGVETTPFWNWAALINNMYFE